MKKRTYPNWITAVEELIALQQIYGYKKGWLVHKLNCWSPPMEVWEYVNKKMMLNLDYWETVLDGGLQTDTRDLTDNEMFNFCDLYNPIQDLYGKIVPLEQELQRLKQQLGSFDIKAS